MHDFGHDWSWPSDQDSSFIRSFFSVKLSTICKNETQYSSKMDRISFSLSYTVVKSHTFLDAKDIMTSPITGHGALIDK